MTKQEAIHHMTHGKKVTHKSFSLNEWMTIEKDILLLEDGVRIDIKEFFKYRPGIEWEGGYDIYLDDSRTGIAPNIAATPTTDIEALAEKMYPIIDEDIWFDELDRYNDEYSNYVESQTELQNAFIKGAKIKI